MKYIFNIVVLIFITFIDVSSSARKPAKQQVTTQDDALVFFNKYGYNPCLDSKVRCSLSLPSILRDYQERFHLRVTGKLDDTTKQHMSRPRCGNKDQTKGQLKAVAALSQYKWSRLSLTYSIHGYPTQISQSKTDEIIGDAFNAWVNYAPLKIEKTCSTCKSDLVIDFASADHADRYSFDGVGGTLAHAFFPEDGRVHFDKDEKWVESFNGYDTNLYLVAVHEIGHALGLDHTFNEESIMYPSYQPWPKSKILPQPDRDAIQTLYGRKQSPSATPATTRSTTTTTTRKSITAPRIPVVIPSGPSHPRCRRFLDAAFKHPDGTLHTFDAGVLWRYLPDEQTWEQDSSSYRQYSRLPNKLAAGVYDSRKKQIVFFTDADVYHYDIDHQNRVKYHNQQGLPRNLRNSIVGAIYYLDQVYVITPTTMRLFQLDNAYQLSDGRALSEEFPGFTGTVKTAFSYGDLHLFFTNDHRVHIWSERLNTWQTSGKPMESNWFACSGGQTHRIQNSQEEHLPRNRDSHHHRPYNHHRYSHH